MAIDNSTSVVTSTESGTGWSVDVTDCNLDADLTLKDFIVQFDGVSQNNSDFTKTSRTSLQYTGASIGSTTVNIYRSTPVARIQEVVYKSRLTSDLWENEFNRLHKITADNRAASFVDEIILASSPAAGSDGLAVPTTEWVRDRIAAFDEAADFQSTLDVTGATTLDSTLNVTGESTLASATISDLTNNRIVIAGTAGVIEDDANLTFDGTSLAVGGSNFTVAQATGNTTIAGTLDVTGDFDINTGNFTIAGATGNTTIAGTLGVTGAATLTAGGTSGETITQGDSSTTLATTAFVKDRMDTYPRKIIGGRLTIDPDDVLMEDYVTLNATIPSGDLYSGDIYYVPYIHDQIAIYNTGTSEWDILTIPDQATPLSASVTTLYTAGTDTIPVDVFAYDNSGSLALELVIWTDYQTRATGLALQDGEWVKSGDASRRWLGVIGVLGGAAGVPATGYARNGVNFAHLIQGVDVQARNAAVRCDITNAHNQVLSTFLSRPATGWGSATGTGAGNQYGYVPAMTVQFPGLLDGTLNTDWHTSGVPLSPNGFIVSMGVWGSFAINNWNSQTTARVSMICARNRNNVYSDLGAGAIDTLINDSNKNNIGSGAYLANPLSGTGCEFGMNKFLPGCIRLATSTANVYVWCASTSFTVTRWW